MLNNLGLTGSQPLLLLAIYNSWAAFLNWVNSLIIDRFGRIKVIVTCLVRFIPSSKLDPAEIRLEWMCNMHHIRNCLGCTLWWYRQYQQSRLRSSSLLHIRICNILWRGAGRELLCVLQRDFSNKHPC